MGRSDFLETVCSAYGLGGSTQQVDQVGGGGNLTWRLTAGSDAYLIKELPVESGAAVRAAAEFERAAFDAGIVPLAEPCPDRDGRLLRTLTGSRGRTVNVRVHRFVPGRRLDRPVRQEIVLEAGRSLARIHEFGGTWAGTLPAKRLWTRPDPDLFEAFVDRWPELVPDPDSARESLHQAEQLARHGVAGSSAQPSHCDHKPDNILIDGDRLIILDWDEAGSCDPRIEALESALRWSWTEAGEPDPVRVAIFAQGYRSSGRSFPAVREVHWAKWVAGIASWYEFNAQRSRGDWPTVAGSSEQDARAAVEALHGLRDSLDKITVWTSAINIALDSATADQ